MSLILILDNLRSTYNVGAILRTAEAVGVEQVIAVGTTPYPELAHDTRPPHVRQSNTRAIAKTALGAETLVPMAYEPTSLPLIARLRRHGTIITALEQSRNSQDLFAYLRPATAPLALIVGPEVAGLSPELLAACDAVLEIAMIGRKESLNVSVAAGIALYQLSRPRDHRFS